MKPKHLFVEDDVMARKEIEDKKKEVKKSNNKQKKVKENEKERNDFWIG